MSVKEPIGGETSAEIMMEGVLAAVAAGRRIENVRLAVGLTEDPRDAYRRAEARSRGLMNQGFFSALYIDHGEITNGTLQPVFDELMASWDSIQTAPPGSVGRVDAGKGARAALDRPGMGLAGYGPQTPRNPQPFRRGGSKVQSMVPLKDFHSNTSLRGSIS